MKTKLLDGCLLETHSDHIGKIVATNRNYYEFPMLEYMKKLALTHNKNGKFHTAVDVGANVGNHTLYFSKYCADYVYAIEPVPANFDKLKENRELNGLENTFLFQCGIGKSNGTARFKHSLNNMGSCDLIRGEGGIDIQRPEMVITAPFQLLKIDCESMSGEVLESFLPMIKEYKPHIFIEATNYEINSYAKMTNTRIGKRFNSTPTWHLYF